MKYVIGCLAAIGALLVLMIAGCLGLFGVGAYAMSQKLPTTPRPEFEAKHRSDLDLLREMAKSGQFTRTGLSPAVVAVYDGDQALLVEGKVTGTSSVILNGYGAGALTIDGRTVECVIDEIPGKSGRYRVFIRADPPAPK